MNTYKIDLFMYEINIRSIISEAVQKKAFELGYKWQNAQSQATQATDQPYLYLDEEGYIRYDLSDYNFSLDTEFRKISPSEFLNLKRDNRPIISIIEKTSYRSHSMVNEDDDVLRIILTLDKRYYPSFKKIIAQDFNCCFYLKE